MQAALWFTRRVVNEAQLQFWRGGILCFHESAWPLLILKYICETGVEWTNFSKFYVLRTALFIKSSPYHPVIQSQKQELDILLTVRIWNNHLQLSIDCQRAQFLPLKDRKDKHNCSTAFGYHKVGSLHLQVTLTEENHAGGDWLKTTSSLQRYWTTIPRIQNQHGLQLNPSNWRHDRQIAQHYLHS